MSSYTVWGPGTFTLKVGAGTAVDYSDECMSFAVNHTYTDVGQARRPLSGIPRAANANRDPDSVTIGLETDLTTSGLYAFLHTNDLAEAELDYTPSTADTASWAGTVILRLPETVDGPEYGAPLTAQVTFQCKGELLFTPQTVAP
jgi:hypothetical protein